MSPHRAILAWLLSRRIDASSIGPPAFSKSRSIPSGRAAVSRSFQSGALRSNGHVGAEVRGGHPALLWSSGDPDNAGSGVVCEMVPGLLELLASNATASRAACVAGRVRYARSENRGRLRARRECRHFVPSAARRPSSGRPQALRSDR